MEVTAAILQSQGGSSNSLALEHIGDLVGRSGDMPSSQALPTRVEEEAVLECNHCGCLFIVTGRLQPSCHIRCLYCKQVVAHSQESTDDADTVTGMFALGCKQCPRCSAWCSRKGGCKWIRCLACKQPFCFNCSNLLGKEHKCSCDARKTLAASAPAFSHRVAHSESSRAAPSGPAQASRKRPRGPSTASPTPSWRCQDVQTSHTVPKTQARTQPGAAGDAVASNAAVEALPHLPRPGPRICAQGQAKAQEPAGAKQPVLVLIDSSIEVQLQDGPPGPVLAAPQAAAATPAAPAAMQPALVPTSYPAATANQQASFHTAQCGGSQLSEGKLPAADGTAPCVGHPADASCWADRQRELKVELGDVTQPSAHPLAQHHGHAPGDRIKAEPVDGLLHTNIHMSPGATPRPAKRRRLGSPTAGTATAAAAAAAWKRKRCMQAPAAAGTAAERQHAAGVSSSANQPPAVIPSIADVDAAGMGAEAAGAASARRGQAAVSDLSVEQQTGVAVCTARPGASVGSRAASVLKEPAAAVAHMQQQGQLRTGRSDAFHAAGLRQEGQPDAAQARAAGSITQDRLPGQQQTASQGPPGLQAAAMPGCGTGAMSNAGVLAAASSDGGAAGTSLTTHAHGQGAISPGSGVTAQPRVRRAHRGANPSAGLGTAAAAGPAEGPPPLVFTKSAVARIKAALKQHPAPGVTAAMLEDVLRNICADVIASEAGLAAADLASAAALQLGLDSLSHLVSAVLQLTVELGFLECGVSTIQGTSPSTQLGDIVYFGKSRGPYGMELMKGRGRGSWRAKLPQGQTRA